MKATTRRRMSMAMRALHFCQAQTSDDTGYTAQVAALSAEVLRSDPLVSQQQEGLAEEHAAVMQKDAVRVGVTQRLHHLYRVGAMFDRSGPAAVLGIPPLPQHLPYREFIPFAKSMLALATANKDALIPVGLGASFVDDLGTAVAALDAALEAANMARAKHVGAGAELEAATSRAVELVRLLDGFNRTRFLGDAEQIAAWESEHNMHDVVDLIVRETYENLTVPVEAADPA